MKYYNTKQRQLLLSYLSKKVEKPISAEQIADEIGESHRISLSAIYRNLSMLNESGSIRKFQSDDGKTTLYQFIDSEKCDLHLHLKCMKCDKIYHMEDKASKNVMEIVKKSSTFNVDYRNTVIYGICRSCK